MDTDSPFGLSKIRINEIRVENIRPGTTSTNALARLKILAKTLCVATLVH
jgi:hypothetical protein